MLGLKNKIKIEDLNCSYTEPVACLQKSIAQEVHTDLVDFVSCLCGTKYT